jgi:hypothetical protein
VEVLEAETDCEVLDEAVEDLEVVAQRVVEGDADIVRLLVVDPVAVRVVAPLEEALEDTVGVIVL